MQLSIDRHCQHVQFIPHLVDKAKYLGITLDRKLLWKHHIDDLSANTGLALNILPMLSSIKWGSDPVILALSLL